MDLLEEFESLLDELENLKTNPGTYQKKYKSFIKLRKFQNAPLASYYYWKLPKIRENIKIDHGCAVDYEENF